MALLIAGDWHRIETLGKRYRSEPLEPSKLKEISQLRKMGTWANSGRTTLFGSGVCCANCATPQAIARRGSEATSVSVLLAVKTGWLSVDRHPSADILDVMPERQLDLFSGSGASAAPKAGYVQADPVALDDNALIAAIPEANFGLAQALACEATRRGLIAAVPALEVCAAA